MSITAGQTAGRARRCRRCAVFQRLSDEADPPLGEHVGILKIGRDLARIRAAAPARVKSEPMSFYEDCLLEQLPDCPMGALHLPDLVWCEVDDQRMLERASSLFFPRLEPLEVIQRHAGAPSPAAKA